MRHPGGIGVVAQQTAREAGKQQVALPAGDMFASVERQIAGVQAGRAEDQHRIDLARHPAQHFCLSTIIVEPLRNTHPAVIAAANDSVDFVPAARSEFAFPQFARIRVDRQAERVAMAGGPYFGRMPFAAHPRVARRHAAIIVQAQNLAEMVGRVLHQFAVIAVTAGDEQIPIRIEQDPPAKTAERRALAAAAFRLGSRTIPRRGHENVLHVGKLVPTIPARAQHGLRLFCRIARIWLGIAEINQMVIGKIRVQRDVRQPGNSHGKDRRQACNGFWVERAVGSHDPQTAGPFGNQHPAIGQKGETPRVDQTARHHFHMQRAGWGRIIPRTCAQWRRASRTRCGGGILRHCRTRQHGCHHHCQCHGTGEPCDPLHFYLSPVCNPVEQPVS